MTRSGRKVGGDFRRFGVKFHRPVSIRTWYSTWTPDQCTAGYCWLQYRRCFIGVEYRSEYHLPNAGFIILWHYLNYARRAIPKVRACAPPNLRACAIPKVRARAAPLIDPKLRMNTALNYARLLNYARAPP